MLARGEDGHVVLEESGQAFPFAGEAFEGPAWVTLTITDWDGEARASRE